MSTTNYLGLNIPDKNSKGRVVTDVFEPNFTKLDQNAEVVDIDKNAIWGGGYGGYIQDTSVTKVVGERYIDQFDRKAYECLVPSHENTTTNYQACNVKDNLSKLKDIGKVVGGLICRQGSRTFEILESVDATITSVESDGFVLKPGIYCLVLQAITSTNTNERTLVNFANPGAGQYSYEWECIDTGATMPYQQPTQATYSFTCFVGGGKVVLKKYEGSGSTLSSTLKVLLIKIM